MERWKMNQAGLVNFWYYNQEEVFNFEDGHLFLRGSNGAGKSITTASLIPFLLDGKKSPERFDPSHSRAKKLRDIALGSKELTDHKTRIGYLYLEYAKKRSQQYLTTGIGLQSGLGEKLPFWGFIIWDNRRIGKEISLQRQIGQTLHTIHPDELKREIGSGGVVVRSSQEYMKYVNKYLFGMDLPVYDSFIQLILQLRSPKLNKDCKPSDISQILTESLPPLTEQELTVVNEVVESLEKQQTTLNKLQKEHELLNKLCKDYQAYNRHILHEKAQGMVSAYNRYQNILQSEQEKEKELRDLQSTMEQLQQDHEEIVRKLREAEEESKVLERPDIKHKDEQLQHLIEREKELIAKLTEKRASIKKHQEEKISIEQKQRHLHEQLKEVADQIQRNIQNMDKLATKAYFAGHQMLSGMDEPSRIVFDRATKHKEYIAQIKVLLDKREEKLKYYQEVSKELQEEQDKKEKILHQTQRLEEKLDQEREQWLGKIEKWSTDNKVLKLDDSLLDYFESRMDQYPDSIDKEELLSPVKDLFLRQEKQYQKRLEQINAHYYDAKQDVEKAEKELLKWKQNPDPNPPRYLEQKRDEGQYVLPFFRAIRFKEHVPATIQLRMESAMEEMGILDAFLAPGCEQDEKIIDQRRILIPQPVDSHETTLADFLEPEELPSFLPEDYVRKVLKSIAVNCNGSTVMETSGKYVLGILQGKPLPVSNVRYIGKENRYKYWLSVCQQLQQQVDQEKKIREELEQQRDHIQTLLQTMREEYDQIPDVSLIAKVYKDWQSHLQQLEQQLEIVSRINEKVKVHWAAYQEIQQNINDLTRDFPDSEKSTFESAEDCIQMYMDTWWQWRENWTKKQGYGAQLKHLEQEIDRIVDDCSSLQEEIKQLNDDVTNIAAQRKALNIDLERLGAEEIRKKINDVQRTIAKCEEKERQIDRALVGYEKDLKTANQELKKIQQKRKWSEFLVGNWKKLILHEQQFQSSDVQIFHTQNQNTETEIVYEYAVRIHQQSPPTQEWIGEEIYRAQEILSDYQPSSKDDICQLEEPDPSYLDNTHENYASEWRALQRCQKRRVFEVNYYGEWVDPFTLRDYLISDIHLKEQYLGEEEGKLLQDAILNNLGRTLRKRIRDAENWKKNMNTLMKSISLHNGLQLELKWIPAPAETEKELHTAELVKLLYADVQTLKESDQQRLLQHFRVQIERAKGKFAKDADGKTLGDFIGEMLDYRRWFTFELRFKKENESWRELTNHRFSGELSTGERATATYIPLLAAVHSRLQDAHNDAPRIVVLDEAFASIDDENIRQLFGYLDKLDFDYIMNSQYLWGDYDTVKGLSICELMRPNNVPFVTVDRYVWNGKKLTPVNNEHPPA